MAMLEDHIVSFPKMEEKRKKRLAITTNLRFHKYPLE
jgi:hypothetical protein